MAGFLFDLLPHHPPVSHQILRPPPLPSVSVSHHDPPPHHPRRGTRPPVEHRGHQGDVERKVLIRVGGHDVDVTHNLRLELRPVELDSGRNKRAKCGTQCESHAIMNAERLHHLLCQ